MNATVADKMITASVDVVCISRRIRRREQNRKRIKENKTMQQKVDKEILRLTGITLLPPLRPRRLFLPGTPGGPGGPGGPSHTYTDPLYLLVASSVPIA